MANVVLGVTGSVACYRAADLARELIRRGHVVRVCLTRSAAEFVRPALFEALTTQPVLVGAFDEPTVGRMAHIDWARWAEVVAVAPATADCVSRLAHGLAEDMLTTLCLATEAPLVVAPAMNPSMFSHAATVEALRLLQRRAAVVVEPASGEVACGEEGQGKLASNEEIAVAIESVIVRARLWEGRTVLVTSGPTREPLDDIRYLSNRSSGRMGSAVARAALLMGATVRVVAGPQVTPLPLGAEVVHVQTANEMLAASLAWIEGVDLVLAAAAVADYRPATKWPGKLRRAGPMSLELVENPDIVAALAKAVHGAVVVAFAAEPGPDLETARLKLIHKGVHAIAVNDVSNPAIGFDADENELVLLSPDRVEHSGVRSKLEAAIWLLERSHALTISV